MSRKKSPEPIELDPWEIEEVEDTKVEVLPTSEESQLAATDPSAEEWVVKYPHTQQANAPHVIEAISKRQKFLQALAVTGSPQKAARVVGLTPRALWLAREKYPDFARNWDYAKEIYNEFTAEEKVRSRAVDGVREAVWFQGKIVGYQIKYDSGLTQFWYKANMRDKYGDKSEVSISGNVNHGIAFMPARAVSVAEWEAQTQKTLERQKTIDITPKVVEVKPSTKIER